MARKKSESKLSKDASSDIKIAIHELALTEGMKTKARTKETDSGKEKIHLFKKMHRGEASARELVYLSFLAGMTTKEEYLDFLKIEKDCAEYDDED